MFDTFPHSHQLESADCGPSCLRMIAKYYGRSYSIQYLREQAFNQTTNILISFLAARAVVSGEMTLGMMMSLTYIVGQLTAPIEQFIGFACAFQDAKISLERLGEIHQKEDEEQTLALKRTGSRKSGRSGWRMCASAMTGRTVTMCWSMSASRSRSTR